MGRTILGIKQLLELSKQWFATPPSGFAQPCDNMKTAASLSMRDGAYVRDWAEANCHPLAVDLVSYSVEIVRKWVQNNGLTVFVDAETIDLSIHTDALETVCSKDVRVAMPFVYFVCPEEKSLSVDGSFYRDCVVVYNPDNDQTGEFAAFWFPEDQSKSLVAVHFYNDINVTVQQQIDDNYQKVIENSTGGKRLLPRRDYDLACSLTLNLLLILQSYPKYLRKINNNERKLVYKNIANRPDSFVLARSSSRSAYASVLDSNRQDAGGSHASPVGHWRRGHWRRQHHGDLWEVQNLQSQVLRFEDGRRYHLHWIKPSWISGEAPTSLLRH